MGQGEDLVAVVIDDQGGITGQTFARLIERAGYRTRYLEPHAAPAVLREEPVNLLVVRQRTVTATMDARPFAELALETAARAGAPKPWIVVFGLWDGRVTKADVEPFADAVIDPIPADLVAAAGLRDRGPVVPVASRRTPVDRLTDVVKELRDLVPTGFDEGVRLEIALAAAAGAGVLDSREMWRYRTGSGAMRLAVVHELEAAVRIRAASPGTDGAVTTTPTRVCLRDDEGEWGTYQDYPPSLLRHGAWDRTIEEVARTARCELDDALAGSDALSDPGLLRARATARDILPLVLAIGRTEDWIDPAGVAVVLDTDWPYDTTVSPGLYGVRQWGGCSAASREIWEQIARLHGIDPARVTETSVRTMASSPGADRPRGPLPTPEPSGRSVDGSVESRRLDRAGWAYCISDIVGAATFLDESRRRDDLLLPETAAIFEPLVSRAREVLPTALEIGVLEGWITAVEAAAIVARVQSGRVVDLQLGRSTHPAFSVGLYGPTVDFRWGEILELHRADYAVGAL